MKILPLIGGILLLSVKAGAQISLQNLHLNFFAGVANYQGDLQDKRYTFSQSKFAGGGGLSYDISDHVSVRGQLVYGHISADDKLGRNRTRNLNFTSRLYEANTGVEYYITRLQDHVLTPYVFAGIAVYHFSPYTYDTSGKQIFLEPLSTEGEGFVPGRDVYKLTQFAIPFGAGAKFSLSENINVGIEVGFRKLFTDYLDDVSTTYVDENLLLAAKGPKTVELAYRGDELKDGNPFYPAAGAIRGASSNKDWYYFTVFTASFRLFPGYDSGGGSGGSKHAKYGCPTNVN